ncbi:unnamed protein product [Protopolystoma xenopodis]|uniref:Uncharacterized protein n=1 Tax=Protopolystoma xenopodis TaxID=117903 RepID=A0A3S5B6I2_9PLAT|nr:unnamed protein product [Protopolystoma xenopodis]
MRQAIISSFAEVLALVERRQAELLHSVRRVAAEKRRALTDQLALIESERDAVRRECDRLTDMIDVRCISKGISYLNDKLDTIASLTEPRENAFLRYQDRPLALGNQNSPSRLTLFSRLVSVAQQRQLMHQQQLASFHFGSQGYPGNMDRHQEALLLQQHQHHSPTQRRISLQIRPQLQNHCNYYQHSRWLQEQQQVSNIGSQ